VRIVDHDLLGNPIYDPLEVLAASVPAPIPGVNVGRCDCWRCERDRADLRERFIAMRMILCPTCGNKRCPKANDHRNECTGSNEPGQKGSAYE
jgi:hypothetical protein